MTHTFSNLLNISYKIHRQHNGQCTEMLQNLRNRPFYSTKADLETAPLFLNDHNGQRHMRPLLGLEVVILTYPSFTKHRFLIGSPITIHLASMHLKNKHETNFKEYTYIKPIKKIFKH